MPRGALGVVKVSEQGDREDDKFMSPDQQRDKLQARFDSEGKEDWQLVEVFEARVR
jgi:hypothetical protein